MIKDRCTLKGEVTMLPVAMWNGPDEIREGLDVHAPQLITSKQEIELLDDWSGHLSGSLYSYDPLRDEFEIVPFGDHETFLISISRVVFMKLLHSGKPTLMLVRSQIVEI